MTTDEPQTVEALQVPAWTFRLDALELLTVFQALRVYLQYLSQQEPTPTANVRTVIYLIELMATDAVEASRVLQITGNQTN